MSLKNAFVNVFGQTINKLFQFEKFFQLIGVISYVGSINPTLKWQLQTKSKIGKSLDRNVFGQTINKLFQFEKFFQLIGVISYVGSINPTLKWQLQTKSKIGKS